MKFQTIAKELKNFWQLVLRVTRLAWGDKKWLVLGAGCLLAFSSAMPFLRSWLSGQLINELVKSYASSQFGEKLLVLAGGVVFADVLGSTLYSIRRYLDLVIWHNIEQKFDLMFLKKRAEIDIASYEDPVLHDLFQNVRDGGAWRVNNLAERQFYLLQNIFEVGIAVTILSSQQWWFALVVLISLLPEFLAAMKVSERGWSISSTSSPVRRKYWQVREHFLPLPYLQELKLLGLAENFLERIKVLFTEFRGKERKNEFTRLKYSAWTELFGQVSIGALMVYLIFSVVHGNLDIGNFTFMSGAIFSLRSSISGTFQNVARQKEDSLYAKDAFKFLDMPPTLPYISNAKKIQRSGIQHIEFRQVSFKYPKTENYVLRDINLSLQRGKSLAIVGLNGAGKTTLVKLLCRFYDPTQGEVLVNGVDLRELDIQDFYAHLGVMFQDYAHYDFKVGESIAFGNINKQLEMAKVKQAARDSAAEEFILEWPEKYEQTLGREFTGGVEPSVGQWQKLGLARLFYRNPDLFILDEPTASVDTDSEAKIFENLELKASSKILVLISHRFSTVRRASEIVVLSGGAIVERGTHEDLLKIDGGLYAKSFAVQAKGFA